MLATHRLQETVSEEPDPSVPDPMDDKPPEPDREPADEHVQLQAKLGRMDREMISNLSVLFTTEGTTPDYEKPPGDAHSLAEYQKRSIDHGEVCPTELEM